MAPPQKTRLRALTADEQAALARISNASSERLDRVRRARALRAVAAGQSLAEAARQAGFASHTTVANLVERFNQQGLRGISIAAGRGRKPSYAAADRATIVATAQRAPDRRTDGTAAWSLSTLQRTLRRGAFPRISTSTVRSILEAAGSSYQRSRTWCPTGTAQRVRKTGIVRVTDPRTEEKRG